MENNLRGAHIQHGGVLYSAVVSGHQGSAVQATPGCRGRLS